MPLLMCQTMPTSEEFQGKMPSEVLSRPKSMEGRKSSKPLMEKRRRARINDSLTQLKTLILEATNKDTSRHSKLEKADILEMTVRYLKNLQRHHIVASIDSEVNATKYRMGYSECIGEVSRFLSPMDNNLVDLRLQLLSHLAQTCPIQKQSPPSPSTQNVPNTQPMSSPTLAPAAITTHIPQPVQLQVAPSAGNTTVQTVPIAVTAQPHQTAAIATAVPSATTLQAKNLSVPVQVPQQSPTNVARIVSGIQVGLPAGITGGEIALVIPPQAFANGQVPSHFIPVYSQQTSVVSPSPAAAIPSTTQPIQSPIGTATASVSQLPTNLTYQSVAPAVNSMPSRNAVPIVNEAVLKTETNTVPCTSATHTINSLPVPTYVTLRSPLQTSHHQNLATLPVRMGKDKCGQELMDMDDQSCWRPW